jgi:hypothetical protein
MPPPIETPQRYVDMLLQSDYFRCSPSRLGGLAEHKEWQHFIVHAEDIHVLVNFSLVDEAYASVNTNREVARLIVMVRTGHWDGDVDRFERAQIEVTPGRIDASFGTNRMRFHDGRYHVEVALKNRPIRAEFEMVPAIVPTVSSNQPLSRNRNISWLFVPRLRCNGTVTVGAETFRFEEALGYHDHNWGQFRWDDDFSWEWGSILPMDPSNPLSAVYMRMSNRARTLCRSQALYLGHGSDHLRFFRDEDMRVTLHRLFQQDKCLQVPRVMSLLAPGTSRDLPASLVVRAYGDGDDVEMSFVPEELSQIVVPSETRIDGVTTINEVSGQVTARGVVRGKNVDMIGWGIFEFIRG